MQTPLVGLLNLAGQLYSSRSIHTPPLTPPRTAAPPLSHRRRPSDNCLPLGDSTQIYYYTIF